VATKKQRARTSSDQVSSRRMADSSVPAISNDDAEKITTCLQERLVALIDLSLTLKHIHWNVVGQGFISVHQMLDPQYAGVQEMVDQVAERIATMGASPSGRPGDVTSQRTWDDYELDRADAIAHLGALDLVYRGAISGHRYAIATTGEIDPVSEDLLIGQTGELEQYHWFVRAHLEDASGRFSTSNADTEVEAAGAATARSTRRAAS
jgi:starvation-inducible DNA-binding protein